MTWLRAVLREILGLFVDDASFAAAILLWLAITLLLLPYLGWFPHAQGLLLFAGLAIILILSALRYTCRNST